MIAPANDLTDRAPVPVTHCATCCHWGGYVSSGQRSSFGQCWVARGPLPLYQAANAECSVRTAGQVMWKPVAVLA